MRLGKIGRLLQRRSRRRLQSHPARHRLVAQPLRHTLQFSARRTLEDAGIVWPMLHTPQFLAMLGTGIALEADAITIADTEARALTHTQEQRQPRLNGEAP